MAVTSNIQTRIVCPGTDDIALIARWRAETFSVLGATVEAEEQSLTAFVANQRDQVALVATVNGRAIGTCLLVTSEIDPLHAVSPWLAGLFVMPEARRLGAGAVLVGAIEEHARQRGSRRLFLYTRDSVAFYERLGWHVLERQNWKGAATAFMARDL